MISWNLWRALQISYVAHPIYRLRGVWEPPPPTPFNARLKRLLRTRQLLLVAAAFAIVSTISAYWGVPVLFALICGPALILVVIVIPASFVLIGTVYGLALSLAVSDAIFVEKAQGRYTLMTLTPRGLAGATWALSSLVIHTNVFLVQIRLGLVNMYVSAGLTILLVIYPVLLIVPGAIQKALVLFTIFVLFFSDYVQSTNTGCLLGMLIPSYSKTRATTRSYAIVAFLTLQFGSYLLVLFLCIVVWPALQLATLQQQLRFLVITSITYVVVREIVTVILFITLAGRLNTSLKEWDDIARIGTRWIPEPQKASRILIRYLKHARPNK